MPLDFLDRPGVILWFIVSGFASLMGMFRPGAVQEDLSRNSGVMTDPAFD
ncbi:MAG: hypothetical protein LBG90_09285 [Spirochaetaceae bacterium]|nr:hypothetical protein [Spirochaetaceae bacterium]